MTLYLLLVTFEPENLSLTGTVTAVSAAGAIGVAGGVYWYLRKVRAKAPVTCGVQSNENRIF